MRHAADKPRPGTGLYDEGYSWQQGASPVAECLATGKQPEVSAEQSFFFVNQSGRNELLRTYNRYLATRKNVDL